MKKVEVIFVDTDRGDVTAMYRLGKRSVLFTYGLNHNYLDKLKEDFERVVGDNEYNVKMEITHHPYVEKEIKSVLNLNL
ncbi:MAG: hypothetical protein DRP15_04005 [Candidatus Aenigmatarchaeota archaeon]|nr:MAG: hypothetical protein DRP15_04005 [Candidatus Aenigmarchaeota archaeon]